MINPQRICIFLIMHLHFKIVWKKYSLLMEITFTAPTTPKSKC